MSILDKVRPNPPDQGRRILAKLIWYNMRHVETSGIKECENSTGESFAVKELFYENWRRRDFEDKKEIVRMFFAFTNDGEKERRCNRKVAPLKQRFLTRCSRMAVSDAVCVI